jgi:hypothetical protein
VPAVPAASIPAAKPVTAGIGGQTRFRVSVAWYFSVCALSGERIRPGDEITCYEGRWCLARVAEAAEDRRRVEGIQRWADRDYADCLIAFMHRMLVAA